MVNGTYLAVLYNEWGTFIQSPSYCSDNFTENSMIIRRISGLFILYTMKKGLLSLISSVAVLLTNAQTDVYLQIHHMLGVLPL